MSPKVSARIQDHFVELTDPRRRKVTYPLIDIVTIIMCTVICGTDDFVSIAWCRGATDAPVGFLRFADRPSGFLLALVSLSGCVVAGHPGILVKVALG